MNALFGRLAVAAVGFIFAGAASATPVTVPSDGTAVSLTNADVTLGGALAASATDTFSTSTFNGSIASEVFTGDSNNIYGGLTFAYQVTMGPVMSGDLAHVSLNGLFGNPIQAGFVLGDGWTNPDTANETSPLGHGVAFDFPSPSLTAGDISAWMVVYTGQTLYGPNLASLQDGLNTSAGILAPIPEPDSFAILIAGLGLMGYMARRRKHASTAA